MAVEMRLDDGRTLVGYDTGPAGGMTVLWQHGTPQTGVPLPPVLEAAKAHDMRVVSYGRPGYGGSTPYPDHDVASAAADVRQLTDALGVDRFGIVATSGGGAFALACAALLPDRVTGVVTMAGIAPYTDEFDWYAGMRSDGALRAAAQGRAARARYGETAEFDPASFTDADWAALAGDWGSMGQDAQRADEAGPDGQIDDDVAYTKAWGFDLADVAPPVWLVHGGADRVIPPSHADWMLRRLPRAELWLRPREGHISVLHALPTALAWLTCQ